MGVSLLPAVKVQRLPRIASWLPPPSTSLSLLSSPGCAFAQFATQGAAQKCLQMAQDESEVKAGCCGARGGMAILEPTRLMGAPLQDASH